MKSLLARFTFPVALGSLLLACSSSSGSGSSNSPPVIDSVDAPSEATATGGNYTVQFTVKFHDPDKDVITKMRLRVAGTTVDTTVQVQNATPDTPGAQGGFIISGSAPKKTYDVQYTVFDSKGAESDIFTKQLTLK